MKFSFWRIKSALILAGIVMPIIMLPLIIAGIIFIKEFFGIALIVVSVLYMLSVYCIIFFDKKYLSKITFSHNGFEVTRLGKQLMSYAWSDITEVKTTPYARGNIYLTFMVEDKQIDMDLNKKMYNAIMILCPYVGIKTMINNFERFKYLNKETK